MSGKLLIVATPIGNLSDLSSRMKESLNDCDLILAEDTRVSIKLLNHFGIKKRMLSCHNFNEEQRTKILLEANQLNQTVALLTDAGTPLISDPGFPIVKEAIACGMQVVPIPGPSAFLLALIASGLPCQQFVFEGFLPDKTNEAKRRLAELQEDIRTIVFYVSPHKLIKTLALMQEILGERKACLARELTKLHEEFVRGTISELYDFAQKALHLGECVLIVSGLAEKENDPEANKKIEEEVKLAIEKMHASGLRVKAISAKCAEQFGLRRSDVYALAINHLKKKDN